MATFVHRRLNCEPPCRLHGRMAGLHPSEHACLPAQDAAKLLPGSSDVLCRCAKSWSDACYLDFVTPERFTDADRRALNQRAVEYAKQVLGDSACITCICSQIVVPRSLVVAGFVIKSMICNFMVYRRS